MTAITWSAVARSRQPRSKISKTSIARVAADEIAATGAVADEEIRHPKREAIEGAGGRHPGVEIAGAPQILDRRLRATADHLEHQATRRPGQPRKVIVEGVLAFRDVVAVVAAFDLLADVVVLGFSDRDIAMTLSGNRQHRTLAEDLVALERVVEVDRRAPQSW